MDSLSIVDIVAKNSDQWYPRLEPKGTVHLEKESGEIIVAEDSVGDESKIKIVDYEKENSLPDHKVKVKKTGILDPSTNYNYEAKVVDDELQHNTDGAQKDAQERREKTDPLISRRSKMMNEINKRTM